MADGSDRQDVTTADKPKRRHWLWVVAALLVFLVWNYWPVASTITISPETTYITGPLNPDGTVNYFQAIVDRYSEGVTPENNAAVLLVRALGPKVFDEEVRTESLRQLGLTEEELAKDRPYFETFEDFHKRHVLDEAADSDGADPTYVLDELNRRPWSAKDHPLVAAWLEANEKPLELIVEASRRERFHFPLVAIGDPPNILDSWQFHFQAPYEGIRPLLVRAMLKLGSGRPQQAYADLVAAHTLARGPGDGSMPSLMLAIGVQTMVNEADHAILQSDLTSHDLRSILAARQALPTIPSFASVFDNERLFALDCVMLVYRRGLHAITGADSPSQKVIMGSVLAVDWDEVLKTTNYWWGR
ncbi:MAG TPA: hypothetical protein ENH80_08710, partial [Phycisphaerae bacterium]|nr:hypothetical protein [Phycisphaerae bacterium]